MLDQGEGCAETFCVEEQEREEIVGPGVDCGGAAAVGRPEDGGVLHLRRGEGIGDLHAVLMEARRSFGCDIEGL